MKIAAKEIEETKYWLLLCERAKSYPFKDDLKEQIRVISLIVYKIISSSKSNK